MNKNHRDIQEDILEKSLNKYVKVDYSSEFEEWGTLKRYDKDFISLTPSSFIKREFHKQEVLIPRNKIDSIHRYSRKMEQIDEENFQEWVNSKIEQIENAEKLGRRPELG